MDEETQNKKPKKKRKIILIVLLAILGVLAIVALVFVGTLVGFKNTAKKLTAGVTEDFFKEIQTSIIYDINGNEITSLSGEKELYYIESEEIPDILKTIFVEMEDKDFYSHSGIDLSAIVRSAWANITSADIEQGASTITQQLAKNMFLTQEVSWERKITEMYIAFELEDMFSKDDILEFYINNIYFSSGYYGIEAAAEGYFDKSVSELDLSELAFLAAIPNNPSRYDPVNHYDSTIERRDRILRTLYASGSITALDYYEAVEEEPVLIDSDTGRNNYVDTYVFYCATRALMEAHGFEFKYEFESEEEKAQYSEEYDKAYSAYQTSLFTSGYRIYTSIDMDKQEFLQDTVNEQLKQYTDVNDEGIYEVQGAATCIDNTTGFVTAIVGGREQDYNGYTLNRAYQSYRQPGSSIKPLIVYTPYLMQGHTPEETIEDTAIEGGPANFNDVYRGTITLTEALGVSSNVCAWKIMQTLTPQHGISFLKNMDFTRISEDEDNQSISIGGFTYGVTTEEMASAYATLENDGEFRNPTCIMSISASNSSVIVDNTNAESVTVYDAAATRTVTSMLKYGVDNQLIPRANLAHAIVAAKSGTTNDNKDGWFAGYSRYYTTVVWVGADMPVTIEGLSGSTYPLNIWREYMEYIHRGLELRDFSDASELETEDETEEASTEEPTTVRATLPDNQLNIYEGDTNTDTSGMQDQDVDVSGMGDQDAVN